MKLTPMDISNKEFKKVLRGYDTEEVDEFLDSVVDNYETIYKENSLLKDKIANINEKVEHYSKIENTIQNTLLLAQNSAEQVKINAEKEAELILKNANETAQRIIDKAHNDVIKINDEYDGVKQEFAKFRAKFRHFIGTQLDTFDDLEKDVIREYNISTPVEEIEEPVETSQKSNVKEMTSIRIEGIKENVINQEMEEIKSFFAK